MKLKVWQLHFENRTMLLSWVTLILVLVAKAIEEDVNPDVAVKSYLPKQYWQVRGYVIAVAIACAVFSTLLRLTSFEGLNNKRWAAALLSPVQYVSCLLLLAFVFVMFVGTLVAGIAYLAMYWWYNPGVFKGVQSVCSTGGACNTLCKDNAMHCCVLGFHQAHSNAWDMIKGDFSNVKDTYGDVKELGVLPELVKGMDPMQVGNVLSGYFEKHPVQCIPYDEFEREEYLASMGKNYGGALFALLFAAAMCYNYCTVYVFEVAWALIKTTFECCPCCRPKQAAAKARETDADDPTALTEAFLKC